MKTNSNLRFLLALGNQKVIIMQEAESLRVYGTPRQRANISVSRLSDAVASR